MKYKPKATIKKLPSLNILIVVKGNNLREHSHDGVV